MKTGIRTVIIGLMGLVIFPLFLSIHSKKGDDADQVAAAGQKEEKTKKRPDKKKKKKGKEESLATILILPFTDQTGSDNYGYLPGSLEAAINEKLQQEFRYNKFEHTKINKEEIPEEGWTKSTIRELAEQNGIQVVIYGDFRELGNSNMAIDVYLFLGPIDSNEKIAHVENPIDSTLFSVTDEIALKAVEEINRMIEVYEQKTKTKKELEDTEGDQEEKKDVTLASVDTRAKVWGVGLNYYAHKIKFNGGVVKYYGLYGEQYLSRGFSTYGNFAYGKGSTGMADYVRVPSIGVLALVGGIIGGGSLNKVPFSLFLTDGVSFHWRPTDYSAFSLFTGGVISIPTSKTSPFILGIEGGFRFSFNLSRRLVLGLYLAYKYDFLKNSSGDRFGNGNTYGFNFLYLTGK